MTLDTSEYERSLASYAQTCHLSKGRKYQELPHPFRTPYQRDRDRVAHSRAFRRLEYKTQVLVNHLGDHYRTRLTHSIEASLISRSIARTLALHEDLVEAIALAHDLGHPPFGHAGETILNKLMQSFGGFEHNMQSLRVVDILENPYPQFPGLNLTHEVRISLIKNKTALKKSSLQNYSEFEFLSSPNLEAQVVDISDAIAYSCHDLEDGLSQGYLKMNEVKKLTIWGFLDKLPFSLKTNDIDEVLLYHLSRSLIDFLVRDLIVTTKNNLICNNIKTLNDATSATFNIVSLSPKVIEAFNELKSFLLNKFYRHSDILKMVDMSEKVLSGLFYAFIKNPSELPVSTQNKLTSSSQYRVICDYIAGMTDRYALDEYHKRNLK